MFSTHFKNIIGLRIFVLILAFIMLFSSFVFADDNTSSETAAAGSEEVISNNGGSGETSETGVTTETAATTETNTTGSTTEPSSPVVSSGTTGAANNTTNVSKAITPVKPKQITAKDIKRYSTYKGKNATRIPVITYHQIVSDKEKKSKKYRRDPWTISQSTFNKQMKWLYKKHYRTINCDEFYLWYKGKIKLPKRTVLITFDDGNNSAINRSLPVLNKYKFKATHFIIGKPAHKGGNKLHVSEARIKQIAKKYPRIEFQSHTYSLHYEGATKLSYNALLKDANTQRDIFGFSYLAYPYGRKTNNMIKAYKKSGIRMAFSFSDYGFATRKQNIYKIKRLAVKGSTSFWRFKTWCR